MRGQVAGARGPGAAGTGGQASVELVALLPVLLVVGLAIVQLLAAGVARPLAGHAAEAGAIALVQGGDPKEAARAALPGWSAKGLRVRVDGRHVVVRLDPVRVVPLPVAALRASAQADAGPVR